MAMLTKNKSKASWSIPQPQPEPSAKPQPQSQGVLKRSKSKSKVSWLQPSPLQQTEPGSKPEVESKPGPLEMIKRSFSRKPSTNSSSDNKLPVDLARRPQWISKVSLLPSISICGHSSFGDSFKNIIVDATSSEIESDDHGEDPDDGDISGFSMKQIRKATEDLSNVFARGMFSTVYYGTLEDGKRVAIKFDQKALYNPHNSIDFEKKIQVLQSLDHPNLVKLYGYLEAGENSIFVTEYIKNGNLRQHLDGAQKK